MTTTETPTRHSQRGEPFWELAELYPEQGSWSEDTYLTLTNRTNRLIEFVDGMLEVLPMPSRTHQNIILWLSQLFWVWLQQGARGRVYPAGLRVRLWPGRIREPDLVLVLSESQQKVGEQLFNGADLAVEIVSPDDPNRDLVTKRAEYARAGIPEYWIVEPDLQRVTVLTLLDGGYIEHGVFALGDTATSPLLPGLTLDVAALFAYAME